jgi:hypothetical protein
MAVQTPAAEVPGILSVARPRSEAVEMKKVPAIRLWAIPGLIIVLFEAYVLLRWVTGPNFKSVSPGVTPVPDAIKIAGSIVTYAGIPAAIFCFYKWAWKPWRASGRVSTSALLMIWFATLGWFMDPFANLFSPYFTYNAWFPNMGSWVHDIPFWQSVTAGHPGAMQAYPLLFVIPAYVWGLWGVVAAQAWSMRWARRRWPAMSNAMLVFLSYWWGFVVFTILELVYMRCGLYGYHATIPSLTLWYGHYYQFPIYESVFDAFWCLGYASLLYFRDDQGNSIVERGVDKLRIKREGGRTAMRFLALTGIATVIYMVTYNIPYWIEGLASNEPWPRAIETQSYWTNGICGPSTGRSCGGGILPTAFKGTAYFNLKGELVLPKGQTLPAQPTTFKTN